MFNLYINKLHWRIYPIRFFLHHGDKPWFAATICYCHWFLNSASNQCIKHHFHRLCWGYVENLRDFLNETDHEFSKSGRWSIMTQYNSLVSEYYTKLKGLLDELFISRPVPDCSCGSLKYYSSISSKSKSYNWIFCSYHGTHLAHGSNATIEYSVLFYPIRGATGVNLVS